MSFKRSFCSGKAPSIRIAGTLNSFTRVIGVDANELQRQVSKSRERPEGFAKCERFRSDGNDRPIAHPNGSETHGVKRAPVITRSALLRTRDSGGKRTRKRTHRESTVFWLRGKCFGNSLTTSRLSINEETQHAFRHVSLNHIADHSA